ncbi:hypothetical protein FGE12_17150 [Aggregicoccus sp. 17bor-14]|uniref:hypothetical protein n=1 Tax=Myxococcaceae TaxID=31 RepID=UPI00129CA8EC|nr:MULTISPECIES: hypothetical protein [Myxococcaceae]MBF5044129.1 hypothetical protein [Simulacricoccus sp. 17bor-14]MRI89879.1 hypothetical protein [Aggregicoccus sp. 17bor-14]
MAFPVPPHVNAAQEQVAAALQQAEGKPVDLEKAPWSDIEQAAIKVLGGAFQVQRPEHQMLALGLAGAFALRLHLEHQAFWFPNRDAPEGASVGFPDALIMLSPFGAVMDALGQGKLSKLEELAGEIRRSLASVRFSANPAAQPQGKIAPEDYQRLFDPGFLQFTVLDAAKGKSTFEAKPEALARDIREALGRTQPPLPAEARQQFEGQIVGSLQRLEPGKPLSEQIERAPRVVELMGHLFATVGGTGSAPEEFWQDLVLPLLFIGAPASFPPLDDEEVGAFNQGADPLALFVDVVPYAQPAPEEGLLGAFDVGDLGLPHPAFAKVPAVRLIKLNTAKVKPLLEKFDADKTRDALKRFTAYLEQKAGKPAQASPQGQEMLNAALTLLTDLRRSVVSTNGDLCLRRLTEAEAASEQALALVRKALSAPRIILT